MNAFIVRPFGTKEGVDFDRVETALIRPALEALDIDGGTTAEILEQGNIREDMFGLLATADLVVADLSIHNANVFYELGIRHALRDKHTLLIRCAQDDVPFDLRTDRYLSYQRDDPGAICDKLQEALRQSLASSRPDSPVFQMLPDLQPLDSSRLLAVPAEFSEEAALALAAKRSGDLELLAHEAQGFPWEIPGLRAIGDMLHEMGATEAALNAWKRIQTAHPNDPQANERLSTIYQRLGDLTRSDQANERLLNCAGISRRTRAEAHSLAARNAKSRWLEDWWQCPEGEWGHRALQSVHLFRSYQAYDRAYAGDLNHFYPGINALGMLVITDELATAHPDIWEDNFDSPEEAQQALANHRRRFGVLVDAVGLALEAEDQRLQRENDRDRWQELTNAELHCLTAKQPRRAAKLYRDALAGAEDFYQSAARRQLEIYQRLGVRLEWVEASLAEFPSPAPPSPQDSPHVLLFTGHMIDQPDRASPRFPADRETEAREAILQAVQKERELHPQLTGIAGGACGSDILFHEVCEQLGIPTELYLGLPREQYLGTSVQHAGPGWVDRFNRLCDTGNVRVLCDSQRLPNWLQKKQDYSIWQRSNLWMLYNGLAQGGSRLALIALWDGGPGDGVGGTEDMVRAAKERSAKTLILSTQETLGL